MDLITFESIWPRVQLVLEPFTGIITIVTIIFVAGLVLGIFIKNMRS